MSTRSSEVPEGYTHVELPKPQVRGWDKLWGTLGEALDEPEKAGVPTYYSEALGRRVTIPEGR
jgi:hypothetical protein